METDWGKSNMATIHNNALAYTRFVNAHIQEAVFSIYIQAFGMPILVFTAQATRESTTDLSTEP